MEQTGHIKNHVGKTFQGIKLWRDLYYYRQIFDTMSSSPNSDRGRSHDNVEPLLAR